MNTLKKTIAIFTLIFVLGYGIRVYEQRDIPLKNNKTNNGVLEKFPYLKDVVHGIPQFEGDISIQHMNSGTANKVFRITNKTTGNSYALKIFNTNTLDDMAATYQFFDGIRPFLTAHGIITPATVVFPCLKDEKIIMVNEFLEGNHITDEHFPKAGAIMARLHLIDTPERALKPRRDMAFLFEQCKRWEHCSYLETLWNSLDFSYLEQLPKGLIHGDFSYSNILADSNGQLSLIDCDYMRYDYLLDDIGLAQIYYGFDDEGNFKLKEFASFIAAYQKIRPLTDLEKAHLITQTKRCLIEIAMALRFYLYDNPNGPIEGVLGDPVNAELITQNAKNHYIDPEFMVKGIKSLHSTNQSL